MSATSRRRTIPGDGPFAPLPTMALLLNTSLVVLMPVIPTLVVLAAVRPFAEASIMPGSSRPAVVPPPAVAPPPVMAPPVCPPPPDEPPPDELPPAELPPAMAPVGFPTLGLPGVSPPIMPPFVGPDWRAGPPTGKGPTTGA